MASRGKKGAATAAPTLNELAASIREESQAGEEADLARALRLGVMLRQARPQVPRGTWRTWVKANHAGSVSTANRQIQIADPANDARVRHCKSVREALAAIAKPKPATKAPSKPKREAGKRLRALHALKREKDSNLLVARIDIVKMVGILEAVDLPTLGFGDADEETKEQIFDEICLLWAWVDTTLTVLKVEIADQQIRERIRKLREGTNGRSEAEIATAQKLAENLARKLERGQLRAVGT